VKLGQGLLNDAQREMLWKASVSKGEPVVIGFRPFATSSKRAMIPLKVIDGDAV
jgi:hypothetical protein